MADKLPGLIDPRAAASSEKFWALTLPQMAFPRLVSALANADGPVDVKLRFFREPTSGLPAFELSLGSTLSLECQRTLEPFDHPVSVRIRAAFAPSEGAEALVPETYEPWRLADGERVNPMKLIEDELLLAIPLSPRKAGESFVWRDDANGAHAQSADAGSVDEEKTDARAEAAENPFAVLAELRGRKPS